MIMIIKQHEKTEKKRWLTGKEEDVDDKNAIIRSKERRERKCHYQQRSSKDITAIARMLRKKKKKLHGTNRERHQVLSVVILMAQIWNGLHMSPNTSFNIIVPNRVGWTRFDEHTFAVTHDKTLVGIG